MRVLSGDSVLDALERVSLLGLAAVDAGGRQTFVSEGFAAMLGWSRGELTGKMPPFVYWPEEEMGRIQDAFARTIRGEAPRDGFLLRFMRKDGRRIDVRVFLAQLQDAHGSTEGWLAATIDVTARMEVERQLRRSEALLAEAQRIAQVGSWEWDVANDRIWWSEQMYRVYGLEPGSAEIDYRAFLDRLPPGDREEMQRVVARALEAGDPFLHEHRVVLPDGSLRTVLARGAVEKDASGNVVRMAGTGQDVTELKRLQEERARLERERDEHARLHAILEQLPAGVMIADAPSGRVAYSNRAAKEIFGGSIPSPEAALSYSRTFAAWREDGTPLPSNEFPLVRAVFGETVAAEGVEFERPDGTRAFVRANAAPLRDAAGTITGAVTAYYDTTELRRAQEERERERERLHLTFMQAPVALAIFHGPEHRYEMANPRYEEMVGRQKLAGKTVRDAFPELPRDHSIFTSLDRSYHGEPVTETEMHVPIRRAGAAVPGDAWFNFALQPLRGADGAVIGSMVVAADVTEQVEARRKLEDLRAQAEAASRSKDEFLAILGHELRNPLAPIVTALQLLRAHGLPGGERERALIERQVQHLLRLVDDLLDVSRVTRGNVELRRRPTELAEVISAAIELASPLLEERRHHLDVQVERDLGVNADPARLAQVVSNLLTNAAKYTAPGGHIAIRGFRDGAEAVIEVVDDGIGIAPELLPRIFDLFVQGGRGIDRSEGGLGLGLAIVKSLVGLHGGRVEGTSAGPGRGSTFTVRLPAIDGAVPRPEPRPRPAAPQGPPLRVLIVDDNADAALLLEEAVREFGHEVRASNDAPSALELAERFRPDVALVDLGLPVMDGFELARRLRALPGLAGVRLVAVTGYGLPVDRQRSREAGFDVHLVKPVDLDEIAAVLREPERMRR